MLRATRSLESALRQYRKQQAYMYAIPAMNVFGDKILRSILSKRPRNLEQLGKIKGIGQKRKEVYGPDILHLVNASKKSKRKMRSRFFPLLPELKKVVTKRAPVKAKLDKASSVYILELEQGRVYVGSSKDVQRRIEQHKAGAGSAYTRIYKPTGVLLPRLGNVSGEGDAAERDETLKYMHQRGIPYVRGWKFTQVIMPASEIEEAESNIRELFNLCRRCGFSGHFITQCQANFDRLGHDLRDD